MQKFRGFIIREKQSKFRTIPPLCPAKFRMKTIFIAVFECLIRPNNLRDKRLKPPVPKGY